ncbi:MAG: hypothetical protein OEV91_07775 [Desulfobulbaceae bacterium]|nr:hypothetical protein [Desulfobulbaceae bacterium]
MSELFAQLVEFFNSTQIPAQFHAVDVKGLFTNSYFLVPFIGILGYMLFKRAINGMILLGTGIGLWIFSGTPFVREIYVDGQMQADKILPVAGVGVVVIAVVVYILFIRSD